MKVRQKISGAFRTLQGAQAFARIRAYVSAARKKQREVFEDIVARVHRPGVHARRRGIGDGLRIRTSRAKVRPDSLRVGDALGYRSRTQREVYGVVIKLNRKTATVRLATGQQWGVPYSLLFYILDAQEGTIAAALDNQSARATPGAEDRTDVEGIDSPPE